VTLKAPDWLVQHGGDVRLGSDGQTWYVYFGPAPDYALNVVPVGNKFGCKIRQTNNGRLLANDEPSAGPEEALRDGLEQLGKTLGWR